MRKLFFCLAYSLTCFASAQEGIVQGTVNDAATKEPLIGVSILFGPGKSASTDIEGAFRKTLPVGDYSVLFRSVGYIDKQVPLHVDANGTSTLAVGMEASISQLDQVVVSAGKFEQRVGEVTQSISVLPPSIVRDKNTTSLEDAIVQVPGVVVVDNDPQIRAGSGFSFGAGSRVMMLVDDLPILSGDIGRPSWSFLPIENLEQVEVIKGASSVLYGSAALSGVINVRTAYPVAEPRTRATVFSGFWDTPGHKPAKWWGDNPPLFGGANFCHSQQFGAFDLVLGGMAFSDYGFVGPERINPDTLAADPQRTGPGGYENRARFNFATRWRNKKVRGLNYGINGNFMKSRSSTILLWDNTDDGLYRSYPGTLTINRGTNWYLDPFVNYTGPRGMRHKLRSRFYRQQFDNSNDQSNGSRMLYAEYQVQKKAQILGETVITAGVTLQNTDSEAELYSGDPDGNGQNTANTYAGYLQIDKKLLREKLMFSGGVRYENFKVNTYEKAQPVYRAGATYRVLKATYVRASYGQGFRFPTIGERYIQTSIGQLNIYPNEQLEPEFSVNMEGGIKQGFKIGSFTGYLDAVVFQQDFDRFVEFSFGQWVPGTFQNLFGLGFRSVNTGGARIRGYEIELAGKGKLGQLEIGLLMGWTHTTPVSTTPNEAYAYSVPTIGNAQPVSYTNTSYDTTDNILKYRVRDLFRSDVGLGWKKFTGGVSVRYNSHVRNIDKVFVDFDKGPPAPDILPVGAKGWMETHTTGDWLVDARFGYKLTEQLKATVIVSNLSNEVYAVRPMAIEAPRSWQIQLAWER
ncbi:MAG: TonB-dependent receptor [Flavobacteriales bacterium]|nr:TonB-dependent receptor [Flavobacteriales bacterium]